MGTQESSNLPCTAQIERFSYPKRCKYIERKAIWLQDLRHFFKPYQSKHDNKLQFLFHHKVSLIILKTLKRSQQGFSSTFLMLSDNLIWQWFVNICTGQILSIFCCFCNVDDSQIFSLIKFYLHLQTNFKLQVAWSLLIKNSWSNFSQD